MRISDWSSDVCSSDLHLGGRAVGGRGAAAARRGGALLPDPRPDRPLPGHELADAGDPGDPGGQRGNHAQGLVLPERGPAQHARARSEEHTSELQSLMRISYAVFCLKKKNQKIKY